MALKDMRQELLQYIQQNQEYTKLNNDLFKIHEGNLLPYVKDAMKRSFSQEYYNAIESRIVPINILKRYIDKVSKAYATDPIRTASEERHAELLQKYEYAFNVNTNGSLADRWASLFKGYAWEMFIHKGMPRLRTISFDKFLVKSLDPVDPLSVDIFIKFMGERRVTKLKDAKTVSIFHVYTNEEFDSFDSDGDDFNTPMTIDLMGVNPYGTIPFVYGNRSYSELLPTQDTDILPMTLSTPVLASDLSGAILFTTTSLMYGIDVNVENAKLSPNAFMSLKSDPTSGQTPSIGVIKPQADIGEVLGYIKTMMGLWLETKGVRVGSIGDADAGSSASGIAKMIDEMDTYEVRKENIKFLLVDEKNLWDKLKIMNNYWYSEGLIDPSFGAYMLPDDFSVATQFDEPRPMQSRKEIIEEEKGLQEVGATTPERTVARIFPDYTLEEIAEVVEYNKAMIEVPDDSEAAEV